MEESRQGLQWLAGRCTGFSTFVTVVMRNVRDLRRGGEATFACVLLELAKLRERKALRGHFELAPQRNHADARWGRFGTQLAGLRSGSAANFDCCTERDRYRHHNPVKYFGIETRIKPRPCSTTCVVRWLRLITSETRLAGRVWSLN
jgi:hypothetical protein